MAEKTIITVAVTFCSTIVGSILAKQFLSNLIPNPVVIGGFTFGSICFLSMAYLWYRVNEENNDK